MKELVAALLSALERMLTLLAAYLGGKTAERKAALERETEVLHEQNKIAARPAAGRDALLERMRQGDL